MFPRLSSTIREIGATFPVLRAVTCAMTVGTIIGGLVLVWSFAVNFNIVPSHLSDDTFYTLRVAAMVHTFFSSSVIFIAHAVGYTMLKKKRREAEANTAANETSDDDQ